MKYQKVVLSLQTIGFVFDRLKRLMKSGIILQEHSWTENNALRKNLDFNYCHKQYKKESDVTLRRSEYHKDGQEPFIVIESDHSGTLGLLIDFGDVLYFGKDEIRIKSGKPDTIVKKNYVIRLRLLCRPPYDYDGKLWGNFIAAEKTENEMDRYTEDYFRRIMEDYVPSLTEEFEFESD